ncbi:alpha/beta hydrolase fold domain-containing protein [Aquibacillus halophilus]|uniref:Alpha/beta hydrolase fold domain-containing protein n=2 Tax=Aquibacillus halophilus TaxID=930132 RepID=A0A6A8DGB2_9BACI|nr:alpha/beta hydrolase [Aquibacillus halophilus]MRH43586.1 alpha/beta hydrolase fold domain-containing protein [Aquibacillus halophilus]
MIDKQLRIKGMLYNLLINKPSEEKYIKFMHTVKKQMEKRKGQDVEGLQFSEEWITRKDGTKLRICIYKPLNPKKEIPGVLWLHGGGYSQGIPELFANTYKRLIGARDCVIVAPDYRLSIDEAPYPAALDDSYTALLWMKSHAKELGIRDNQLIVGGESAGGGLTAAITLYARDQQEVTIAFQMPLYPMMDDRMITESAKENNAPIWNSRTNRWAWKLYLGELFEKDVPVYAAPARATDYSNLPPTITFVGDIEPFRDETIQYVQNLKQAGVPVDFELFKGCYHGFDIINPKAKISKQAISFFIHSFQYAVDHYFAEQK